MRKNFFIVLILCLVLSFTNQALSDDNEEWSKHLDVYNSDGLDRPVNAIEYKKTMDELQKLKDKKQKKKKLKKGEMPEPMTTNEPVKIEKNDIVKITTPLYYDGQIIPIGFYKITCEEINKEYYFNLIQGKSTIIKVKANKTSHMNFCPEKVTCLETEIYQNKYYKINYKTLDYAVSGYLAIINN